MLLLDEPDKVRDFLLASGWISDSTPISVSLLPGGVSNHVWRIDAVESLFVLKQPLEKLATAVDWRSGLGRLEREVACMRFLAEILPDGQVPEVVEHDPTNHVVSMTSAPGRSAHGKGC